MYQLKQHRHFSFMQGLCSVFFGSRQSRVRLYYSSFNKRSDSDALKSDFRNIGNDMKIVLKKEANKHSIELADF